MIIHDIRIQNFIGESGLYRNINYYSHIIFSLNIMKVLNAFVM